VLIMTGQIGVLLLDAANSWVRLTNGAGALVLILVAQLCCITLVNLFAFPDMTNPSATLSWLDDATSSSQQANYDTLSVYNSSSLALVAITMHWLYTSFKDAQHGRLSSIAITVHAVDDPWASDNFRELLSPYFFSLKNWVLRVIGGDERD